MSTVASMADRPYSDATEHADDEVTGEGKTTTALRTTTRTYPVYALTELELAAYAAATMADGDTWHAGVLAGRATQHSRG
jgi:hypothetical protein